MYIHYYTYSKSHGTVSVYITINDLLIICMYILCVFVCICVYVAACSNMCSIPNILWNVMTDQPGCLNLVIVFCFCAKSLPTYHLTIFNLGSYYIEHVEYIDTMDKRYEIC